MKIVISIFCLPYEIDELEQIINQLKRSSYYLNGNNEWILDVSLGVSDYLVDWEKSSIPKSYFIDKLKTLEEKCDWCTPAFHHDDHIKGCVSQRRNSMKLVEDADYFIWLDTDIIFEERTLSYVENTINSIGSYPMSIITPEIVRIWDNTWDCLVNDEFIDKPLDYHKTNDPYQDCGIKGDVTVTSVYNTSSGQPRFKFAGGWFTCISGDLLRRIGIPESLGHYGLEDTFIMNGAHELLKLGEETHQFKLKNVVVCENYKYRDNTYLTSQLKVINRKEEFLKVAHDNYQSEMMKLLNG